MSTERIFGSINGPPQTDFCDELTDLWHRLATQHQGTPEEQVNSGMTQLRPQITLLWEIYKRARPKITCEIGVSQAGTFASWCVLAPHDALIIGIDRCLDDARPRPNEPVHPLIARNVPHKMTCEGGGIHALGRNQQRIVGINGWSYEPETLRQLLEVLDGRKIDWLFADSSHQAEKFAQEFPLYWDLIAEGGVYATHDIQESKHPDVTKWKEWRKLKETLDYSACFEFLGGRDQDSYGIGVFIKP